MNPLWAPEVDRTCLNVRACSLFATIFFFPQEMIDIEGVQVLASTSVERFRLKLHSMVSGRQFFVAHH